jgi:SAM-dependent methyltransferase
MGNSSQFLKYSDKFLSQGSKVAIVGPGKDIVDISYFLEKTKNVFAFDYVKNRMMSDCNYITGDFNETSKEYTNKFNVVWACHVLEHQRNVGVFLDNIHRIMSDDGTLFISVPPLKHNIVGGHVSLWNMGLLMYNLCLSKFDVKNGKFKKNGYNLFGIVHKSKNQLPEDLIFDRGDLEKLSNHWNCNFPIKQDTDGRVDLANWNEI